MIKFKIDDVVQLKDDSQMYFVDGYEAHKNELLVFIDGGSDKTVSVDDVERHWHRGKVKRIELIEETYVRFCEYCEKLEFSDMRYVATKDTIAAYVKEYLQFNGIPEVGFLHSDWLAEHGRWTYGESIDEEKKTHPDKVPYEKLSIKRRLRDYLIIEAFSAVISERVR